MKDRLFSFVGGDHGQWRVRQQLTISGEALASVGYVSVVPSLEPAGSAQWILRGVTSNERYVERAEKEQLLTLQESLGRPDASYAALIPIRKNASWWAMTQDERRSIFEATSHHIAIGMRYLPAIARKLHHCRDLPNGEQFDFLTWFDFAPEHEALFDKMLLELRQSLEWHYVDREIDIRLKRV